MNINKKDVAIVPGSFDPITNGHLDIVKRAAAEYKKVYIAVLINRDKKYMFNLAQRTRIAKAATLNIPNVEVISSEGMLWRLAKRLRADAIVKGYRNNTDLKYEQNMAEYNKIYCPETETVLLKAENNLKHVSSTIVREMILSGKQLNEILPNEAICEINKIRTKRKIKF